MHRLVYITLKKTMEGEFVHLLVDRRTTRYKMFHTKQHNSCVHDPDTDTVENKQHNYRVRVNTDTKSHSRKFSIYYTVRRK